MAEVAEDLKPIFKVRRAKTAEALAEEFKELYGKRFPKAVSVFEAGIGDALIYLSFPGNHHAKLRTTNTLERLFKEVKRRTRVVGVFPKEGSRGAKAANDSRSLARRRWRREHRARSGYVAFLGHLGWAGWSYAGSADTSPLRRGSFAHSTLLS
jgi:transposase-like protein